MSRHWKGVVAFLLLSLGSFIAATMTLHFAVAVGVLMSTIVIFSVYMMGESDFAQEFYARH